MREPSYNRNGVSLYQGDALSVLRDLPSNSIHCCVTSPPYYGLRDYGVDGQIGLEETPTEFVAKLVEVFREVRRVLRDDGTCWVNMGDSYSGYHGNSKCSDDEAPSNKPGYVENMRLSTVGIGSLKPKDLIGVPWMLAFALRDDAWWLRQDIIWSKPNPMPESVTDRCTKAHEYIFLLSKRARYYYDAEAVKEEARDWGVRDRTNGSRTAENVSYMPRHDGGRHRGLTDCNSAATGRNRRSVWTVTTSPYKEAHFATFPPKLITPCILAGCPENGTVLDPFSGAATTALVAWQHNRNAIGIELNAEYIEQSRRRLDKAMDRHPLFETIEPENQSELFPA